MSIVANPIKGFQYAIEIDGFPQFLAQKVTSPKYEIEKTEHGEANVKIKTAGMANVGDLTIEHLIPAPQGSKWAWDWIKQAQNPMTGSGGLAVQYKKTVVIRELAPDLVTTVKRTIYYGVWPFSFTGPEWDRVSSDNAVKKVECSVDKMEEV